jgi:Histidine kinase-like ATPase domain
MPWPGGPLARGQEWPLRSQLGLPAVATSVRFAREHARLTLGEWHLEALTDTVQLLVSELATNAVRASAAWVRPQREAGRVPRPPRIGLWLASDGRSVLIQVWDGDHRHPARRDAGPDAEAGRGLMLVGALSTRWGCYAPDGEDGKIVWALCDA